MDEWCFESFSTDEVFSGDLRECEADLIDLSDAKFLDDECFFLESPAVVDEVEEECFVESEDFEVMGITDEDEREIFSVAADNGCFLLCEASGSPAKRDFVSI